MSSQPTLELGLECELCGLVGREVGPALLRLPAGSSATFKPGYRCRDHVECRRRAELDGRSWPLLEEAPAQLRRRIP